MRLPVSPFGFADGVSLVARRRWAVLVTRVTRYAKLARHELRASRIRESRRTPHRTRVYERPQFREFARTDGTCAEPVSTSGANSERFVEIVRMMASNP
ncbi:MAG: hypothetical protein FWE27_08975 [Defluviitaleaceae bacterium]|nr:hypothetical protein [Defluviitaleaceae bacterium]